jgi:glycogen debranching enzyme
MSAPLDDLTEWPQTDGLGGFASGTTSMIRTRRYHGLLVSTRRPPADRFVLVNGLETHVLIDGDRYPLSTHRYHPGVIHPRGVDHQISFSPRPWPTWTFDLSGHRLEHGLFMRRACGDDDAARRQARGRFLAPMRRHLESAGLGHVSEIADASAPHVPRGCPFQAWSLAELLRLERSVLRMPNA